MIIIYVIARYSGFYLIVLGNNGKSSLIDGVIMDEKRVVLDIVSEEFHAATKRIRDRLLEKFTPEEVLRLFEKLDVVFNSYQRGISKEFGDSVAG